MGETTDELTQYSQTNTPTTLNRGTGIVDYTRINSDSDDPEVIRARIEQTRAEMSETVNTIQEKLSPEHLKQQAQEMVREATVGKVEEMANMANRKVRNWRSNMAETIKQNPVPAALIGIGLGWLLMSGRDDSDVETQYYYPQEFGYSRPYSRQSGFSEVQHRASDAVRNVQERAGDMAHNVQEKASDVAHNVQDKVTGVADQVQEKVSGVASQARMQTEQLTTEAQQQAEEMRQWARYEAWQAKRTYQQTLQDNPLALAAVALAAGAAVGLSLPSTQTENELMGQARDRLVQQAQTTAQETMDKVRHVAEEATQAATEEAKREAEKQGLPKPTGQPMRENT
jgi:Skp family chaperone for outer membrane proteins